MYEEMVLARHYEERLQGSSGRALAPSPAIRSVRYGSGR
jgi:hypothetical protein